MTPLTTTKGQTGLPRPFAEVLGMVARVLARALPALALPARALPALALPARALPDARRPRAAGRERIAPDARFGRISNPGHAACAGAVRFGPCAVTQGRLARP